MLSPVYNPFPVKIRQAHGVKISTDLGEYLDTFSGIGVLAFGHTDQATIEAVGEKLKRYSHTSNYFLDEDAVYLGEKLLDLCGKGGEVFFTNSGTEATEAAIKAVRRVRKGKLVSFHGNFHGRTMGALSLTYNEKIRKQFEPLLPDVVFLPLSGEVFEDFARANDVAAVFVEAIQGNSGVNPIPEELADTISKFKKEKNYLIVADEIQSGLCRSGENFAYQLYGLDPDIVIVGKALGGGLPLGAAIFLGFNPFGSGDHGSTFAPNPISLAAGRAVLSRMDRTLLENVKIKGEYLRGSLEKLDWVESVRGAGLMLGVATRDPVRVKEAAFQRHVLLNVTNKSVRFLPALNVTREEIDEIVFKLDFGG